VQPASALLHISFGAIEAGNAETSPGGENNGLSFEPIHETMVSSGDLSKPTGKVSHSQVLREQVALSPVLDGNPNSIPFRGTGGLVAVQAKTSRSSFFAQLFSTI
jgi:hypothetical protein